MKDADYYEASVYLWAIEDVVPFLKELAGKED